MAPSFFGSALLLGLASASPLARSLAGGKHAPLVKRQDEEAEPEVTQDEWCENNDLNDPFTVFTIWNSDDTNIGWWLDDKIGEIGEDDWVTTLADEVLPGHGASGAAGCAQMGEDCLIENLICPDMFAAGNKEAFWVLMAVKNMQNVFEIARDNLVFEGLTASLRISSIVEDFSLPQEPNPEVDILAYIAGAFTILAGAAAFSHPATRMIAGIAGGAAITASRASVTTPTLINVATLDSTLEDALRLYDAVLRDFLLLANGRADDTSSDLTYDDLPYTPFDPSNEYSDDDYASVISRYFEDGDFLAEGEPADDLFSEAFKWLTRSLVGVGLESVGYAVIGEKDVSESWCTSDNVSGNRGSRWFPDIEDGRCFKLYMPEDRYGYGDIKWRTPDDSVFDLLEDEYGIDLVEFYQAQYDCAKEGDGVPDPENLPSDGSVPLCFYRVPSYQGYEVHQGVDEVDYMDTEDWP